MKHKFGPVKPRPLPELVKTCLDQAADALSCHELYNSLRTTSHRTQYASAFANHHHFFKVVTPCSFFALVISLYKMGETRRDTVNVLRVLKDALKEKKLDQAEYDALKSKLDATKPIWLKVCGLRNDLIGHTNDSLTMNQVFEEAEVTPQQLEQLAKDYTQILNIIAAKVNIPTLDHQTHSDPVATDSKKALEKLSTEHP